ncbi:MAG: gamma-glutamyltransferase [Gemmatimonadota bacterium]
MMALPRPHRTLLLLGFVMALTLAMVTSRPLASQEWETRLARTIPSPEEVTVVRSDQGVAATLNIEASRAAAAVLEAGGNAMDAAAAAWMVLAVVTPNQTGLGAGGYIIYHDAGTGQTYFIDGNVRAPMAAHPAVFLQADGEPMPMDSIRARGMAVGVPGVLRAFDVGLKRWGTRYFDDLAHHAIRLAEDGWEMDRELSLRIHQTRETLQENAREVYMPRGEPLEPGELLRQPAKARALRLIAQAGPEVFYQGEIGEAVARYVQGLGGFLTADDFRQYNVSVDVPLWFSYRDFQVATNPNIAGGGTLALLLKILEPWGVGGYPLRSPERYHMLLEATRLASAQATDLYADPEFIDRPWQGMFHPDFLATRRAQFRPDSRMEEALPGNPWDYQPGAPYRMRNQHPDYDEWAPDGAPADPAGEEGTDHFTIADAHGNVVAVTSTLGSAWYAGLMVPEYGFMLNITGAYFDTRPGGAHEIRPGKRPRSTMTPTIVFQDGRPILTVGSPSPAGMQHVQVLLNILDHGLDPARAIAEPRVAPSDIWEAGVPQETLEALRKLGHPMAEESTDRGAVSVVFRHGNVWLGAADPRRDGVAVAPAAPPGGR